MTDTPDNEFTPGSEPSPDTDLARERDDLKDRLLRTTAEFDNYRKRVERERRELAEAAAADLIRDLLPVLDDFERALAAAGDDQSPLLKGVELTHKQLLEQLRRRGVEPMNVVGQHFDPQVHEAVASEPADGRADGQIVEEFRRGYRLNGRLLRPAMVKVTKA